MTDSMQRSIDASAADTQYLRTVGLDTATAAPSPLPSSMLRFPDGATHRVEIPSVEGPRCVAAVIDAARQMEVPVARLSQGSGSSLLTDTEIMDMATMARGAGIELCLFIRPCASWDASAASRAPAGGAFAASTWGAAQLQAATAEMQRVADLGVRSVLIGDVGLLAVFGAMRARGSLPGDMQAKTSVMLPTTNAASASVYENLGANTLNVAPDLSVNDVAHVRGAVRLPLDVYIESPDDVGGFVRYHELAEIVRVAAPVYVKLGLRNAPNIYPSGEHLDSAAVQLSVERVRRARLALDLLASSGCEGACSIAGASGLAVPVGVAG